MKKAVAVVVSFVVGFACVAGANLLDNPGFETGDFTDWIQSGWYNGGVGDAHSGSYAGNYYISDAIAGENYFVCEQYVPVTGGASYDLTGWMRIAGTVDASESFMELRWYDAAGTPGDQYGTDHLATSADYAEYSLDDYVAPVNAATARVALVVHTTGGTINNQAWHMFDDVSFTQNIPEPGTLAIMGLGIVGMCVFRRARRT